MKLYFARHAESDANILRVISDRNLEHHLTENGRMQAARLGQQLAGRQIAGIFCSPIIRARETAAIVSACIHAPVAAADGLREFDSGVLEGRSDEEAWQGLNHAISQWLAGDLDYRIPEGESCTEVIDRFCSLVQQVIAVGGNDFAFITHSGALRVALPTLIPDLPRDIFDQHMPGFAEYVTTEVDGNRLRCIEWFNGSQE